MPEVVYLVRQPSPSRALIVKLLMRLQGGGLGGEGMLCGAGGAGLQAPNMPGIFAGHIPNGNGIGKGMYGNSGG